MPETQDAADSGRVRHALRAELAQVLRETRSLRRETLALMRETRARQDATTQG
jgi:hypothetical protein